jgi:ankyrin repeat protein
MAKTLVALGAKVNVADELGATPVCVAASCGHLGAVKALASLGADVTIPMNDGSTPVYFAAGKGYLEMWWRRWPLSARTCGPPRKDGVTPAVIAALNGHWEVAASLASLGGQ